MSNNYFKFKQFTVWHDKTAMKVGTDGVLLGAWFDTAKSDAILDIGTGTGLIALMAAQRTGKSVLAVEIDPDAFCQAVKNVRFSKFNKNIFIVLTDFKNFYKRSSEKFDTILCNPPFFSNSLHSKTKKRTIARHDTSLKHTDLIEGAKNLLTNDGHFSLILPFEQTPYFLQDAALNELFPSRLCYVKPDYLKNPKRVLIELRKKKLETDITIFSIDKYEHLDYTEEYKNLTKDFYLKF